MNHNNSTSPKQENHSLVMNDNDKWGDIEQGDNLLDKAINSIKDFSSISSFLRFIGALAVLVSMSMFLLQGWSESGDFERFCTMLGQTALLSAAGFLIVKVFSDVKGARLFFGLSLVSITTNFTTLGALMYSVFSLDNLAGDYPSFALWQAASGSTALIALAISLLILVPIAWLSFSVLARPVVKKLTLTYIGMNLLLLVPVRELIFIIPLAAIALILMLKKVDLKNMNDSLKKNFSWNTKEGKFARLTLFLPLGIMIIRSLMSYDVGSVEILAIAASIYATSIVGSEFSDRKFEGLLHSLAFISTLFIAAIVAFSLTEIGLPLFALIIVLACIDLFKRSKSKLMQSLLPLAGGTIVTMSVVSQQLIDPSVASALFAIVAGFVSIFTCMKSQNKLLFWLAIVNFLTVPYMYFDSISSLFLDSGWMGLAIGGVLIITLASALERYG